MEQITEKLFESVRNYFSEGVLDFSSLDEYRFYFVTENGKILFGISGWLKHLFTDELRFIALASEYGDVLVTQSSAVVFTWKFKKCDGNAIVVVQKKGNVNCSYKDHLNIFRTIEDFVIDLAEQGCREKKIVNLNLAEALVESENVCLYMDSDSSKYIDGEKRCKPYVHEANRAPLSYGNAVSFSGASRFFVTTEYKTATKPYYLQKTYGCRAGYFSQLTSEELEKICSYSKHVKNLLLEYVTKNFQTSVPAAEVYKRILKRKETISTIPDFAKETADGFERQFLLRKKNRGRKLTAVAASVGAAVMGIVIGTYCLVRNPFVTGESFSSSATISSYNGHKSKVELPSCVRILATRTVGKKAFAFKSLKSLSMADTYYYIRESAFMSCRKLSEVKLSANLREIDEGAFSGCSISEISIPPTVYYLGDCVFEGNPLKKNHSRKDSCRKISAVP